MMFDSYIVKEIREAVRELTGQHLPEHIEVKQGEGLRVCLADGRATITAENRNALARGFFLLARAAKEGKTRLDIQQTRRFASCGVMLDVSRNAVMKPEAVRRLIRMIASLGLNLLMLYTEDTYEVPGYPYLGYLRGRYTMDDLRALDEYAASMDVEMVPCIQTLGHMEQFLQWNENSHLRDQNDSLLPDDDKTYELIEAQITALRSCFRTKRIHVGMDEAHGVGLGRYYQQHGPENRHDILTRHLQRVTEICQTHDFQPMMWSDMFFRLGSPNGDYYDPDVHVPEETIAQIPPVDMVYWDYYHMEEDFYLHHLEEHARMGRSTAFAGGIWIWSGFLPHIKRTDATMRPALRACAKRNVQTVLATMWGDDGAETNPFLAMNQLPIFSESCWQGCDVSDEEIRLAGECLTGMEDRCFRAMGEFYPSERERCTGKSLIWCDLLYPLTNFGFEAMDAAAARMCQAQAVLADYRDSLEGRYAHLCMQVAAKKGEIVAALRPRYLSGDRNYLGQVADAEIPELLTLYADLARVHQELWERDMKRYGWEVLCLRYGGVSARLKDVQGEIRRYLSGELERIEVLDEEPLSAHRRTYQHYHSFVTPIAPLY